MRVLFIFLSLFFLSCSVKEKDFSKSLNDTSFLYDNWWKTYENVYLNSFVDKVLKHNSEINVARLNLLSAVTRYDLLDLDLYPTLSGNLGLSNSRNLNNGTKAGFNFSNALNLSYELDIYGKIRDEIDSAKFSANASAYELESLKLSLVNSSVDYVFDLVYFNEVSILLNDYLKNLELSKELYTIKYNLGKIEELDLLNLEQSVLNAKQNILSNEQNKELIIKNLKDLLGAKSEFKEIEYLDKLRFSDFQSKELNFNIPLTYLENRPDIQSSLNSLKAAFKDVSALEKSIFPSISLGGNLRGTSNKFDDSFKLMVLNGSAELSLPFLDYARVKKNIKLSSLEYEKLKLNYEQSLQTAINEFLLCKKDYEFYGKLLENIIVINEKQARIKNAYQLKYEAGKVELKDFLDAQNNYINSHQEILRQKLSLLKTQNLYYKITSTKFTNDRIAF